MDGEGILHMNRSRFLSMITSIITTTYHTMDNVTSEQIFNELSRRMDACSVIVLEKEAREVPQYHYNREKLFRTIAESMEYTSQVCMKDFVNERVMTTVHGPTFSVSAAP